MTMLDDQLEQSKKEKEDADQRFADKVGQFMSESSLTPLTRMYKSASVFTKTAWCLTFCFAIGMFSYYTYVIVKTYYSYPSEVNVKLQFSQRLEFPAITVCNMNPLRMHALKKFPDFEERLGMNNIASKVNMLYKKFQDDEGSEEKEESGSEEKPPEEEPPGGSPGSTTTPAGPGSPSGSPGSTTTPAVPGSPGGSPGSTTTPAVPGSPGGSPGSTTTPAVPPGTTTTAGSPGGSTTAPGGSPGSTTAAGAATTVSSQTTTTATYNQWEVLKKMGEAGKSFYKTMDAVYKNQLLFTDMSAQLTEEEIGRLAHNIDDFMISCKWLGFPCSPSNFTEFFNYKYGNCWTLNSVMDKEKQNNNDPLKVTSTGPLASLVLEMNIEQHEYVKSITPDAGVRVVIHGRKEMPFPEDEGFVVSPGYTTMVGLRQKVVTRLPPPHGNCTDKVDAKTLYSQEYNVDYSTNACLKTCLQKGVYKECGCALAQYPFPAKNESIDVCVCIPDVNDTVQQEMTQCAIRIKIKYMMGEMKCNCPLPCKTTMYQTGISTAKFPADNYKPILMATIEQSSGEGKNRKGDFEENVAKLVVYYEDLNYELVETLKSYTEDKVLSDFGGLIGLWLGASFLTALELAAFFGDSFAHMARKIRRPKKEEVKPIIHAWRQQTLVNRKKKADPETGKKKPLEFDNKAFDIPNLAL